MMFSAYNLPAERPFSVDPIFALRGLPNPRLALDLAIQAEQIWIY